MNLVNLNTSFGHKWQIAVDESASGDRQDPCSQVVVCRHGLIYAVGPTTLGAATDRAGEVVRKLRAIDGVEIVEETDAGANAIFHLAKIRYVQRVMQPRPRQRLRPATPPDATGGERCPQMP